MHQPDFWERVYIDGDSDKDDYFGQWHEDPKYVNEPPHVFIREDLTQPKPSTDLSIVASNPYKEYLLYTQEDGWFVGWWDRRREKFLWTTHNLKGMEVIEPTHWLPLPNNP